MASFLLLFVVAFFFCLLIANIGEHKTRKKNIIICPINKIYVCALINGRKILMRNFLIAYHWVTK